MRIWGKANLIVQLVLQPLLDAGCTVISSLRGLKLQQAAMLWRRRWMTNQVVLYRAGDTSMVADMHDALQAVLPPRTSNPHPVCSPKPRFRKHTHCSCNSSKMNMQCYKGDLQLKDMVAWQQSRTLSRHGRGSKRVVRQSHGTETPP